MTEVAEWGRGLTGPFMKSLNLPGDTPVSGYTVVSHPYSTWCFARESDTYRLPADHFVYTVLDYNEKHGTSFVPWAGGDKAPDDWDGGGVLLRSGSIYFGPAYFEEYDLIIGYTRKEPATDDDGEYVRVKKMTEAEARDWIMSSSYVEHSVGIIHAMREFGIITETPVERFKRENPGLSADDLLAKALENNK